MPLPTSRSIVLYNIRRPKGSCEPSVAGLPAPSPEATAVARALDTPRLTLEMIGKAIGASRFALAKYRNGQRPIPAARRIQLAEYREAHARQVQADADALRTSPPGEL